MSTGIHIWITDKTGKRFWNTSVSAEYKSGERHNLEQHLTYIKSRHKAYAKVEIDPETARIETDAKTMDELLAEDDELLKQLLA